MDVVVVGGGVVGLSAALAMHRRGLSVTLLDSGSLKVSPNEISPRVYAINHASQRLFQQLNVWDRLQQDRLSPYRHMHVWDEAKGNHIDFDSRMIAAERLGSIIDDANIKQALLAEIATSTIQLLPESTVTAVDERLDEIEIRTAQQSVSAKLLIIADGALSPTRTLLKVPVTQWSYHQEALVTTVQTEKSHEQTAFQIFNAEGTIAFLPLVDTHQCSIVWSGAPHLIQQRMTLSEETFNQQLTTAFAAKLGQTSMISKRYAFPLQMRHVGQYTGSRWLLMGDAAHTIHPLAGLGLNVGLADLTAWIGLLEKDNRNLTTKKALGAYQRHRKYAVWQTIALMEGFKTLFLNPFPPVVAVRGLGLKLCNQLMPIKRLFIEHATG